MIKLLSLVAQGICKCFVDPARDLWPLLLQLINACKTLHLKYSRLIPAAALHTSPKLALFLIWWTDNFQVIVLIYHLNCPSHVPCESWMLVQPVYSQCCQGLLISCHCTCFSVTRLLFVWLEFSQLQGLASSCLFSVQNGTLVCRS